MCQIVIKIPEAVLYDTHMSSDDAAAFARRTVAMGYYTQNNVSIGYCAEIAGMTEEDFIKFLGQNQISIFRFDDQKEFLDALRCLNGNLSISLTQREYEDRVSPVL